MAYHLGVDLGTTFTAAALSRQGRAEPVTLGTRSVAIPSVAYLADGGEIIFGQPAVRRAATEPSRVAREFKRRVGDPTPLVVGGTPIPAEMLMARLLDWVVGEVSATEGNPPASLAVTHPANWGPYKLDLFGQAIRHLGIEVDHFVPEPVAAASFYASQRDLAPGHVVAVYDLGGGTFDAALVRAGADSFSIVGQPDGMERLGGIDFDHVVVRHVAESVGVDLEAVDADDAALATAVGRLRDECVEAKEALSAETDVSIPLMLPNRHTEVRLTRGEFEGMIRPTLDETLVALRRTIASAELAPEDITAVLLVGGSSRIPLVGQLVASELNRPIAVDARPKDAIPLGAAITAALAAADRAQPRAAAPTPQGASEPAPAGPPSPPATPAATPPPAAVRSRPKALWWAAAAAVLLGAGALVAMLLMRDDDGDDLATVNSGETEDTTPTTTDQPEDPGADDLLEGLEGLEGMEGLEDVLGEGGLSGDGTSSSTPVDPLPGSDWNDDARTQFVTDCSEGSIGSVAPTAGLAPDELCGCIYDDISTSGTDFADFSDAWSAETVEDVDIDLGFINEATMACLT